MKFGILKVFARDGSVEFPLDVPSVVVGRADGSGILIDDLSVSRRHARLVFDSGKLLVEDLGGAAGTFVDGAKLEPHSQYLVEGEATLQFGDIQARYIPPVAIEGSDMRAPALGSVAERDEADAYIPTSGLHLGLVSPAVALQLGRTAVATLTIQNRGHVVDHVRVSVQDVPASWVRIGTPELALLPGARSDVAIVIQPPRSSEAVAGHYDFTVVVTSQEHGREELVIGSFTVLPFDDTHVAFEAVRSTGKFRLVAENRGNTVMTYGLSGQDDEGAFRYGFEVPAVELQPGQRRLVRVRVGAPRKLFGPRAALPFAVIAQPVTEFGTAVKADGQLASAPPLERLKMPSMLLAALFVLAVAGLGIALITGDATTTASAEDAYAGVHMCDKDDAKKDQDQRNAQAAASVVSAPQDNAGALPGGAQALAGGSETGAPYFAQNNPAWGADEYARAMDPEFGPDWCGTTIAQCGCAMTSVATVMALFDILSMPGGEALTPQSVNAWFNQDARKTARGWVSQGYIYGDVIWTAANQLSGEIAKVKPGSPTIRFVSTGSGSEEEVRRELEAGRPIVLEVPGHWIAAVGIDSDGKILINDPYYRDRKTLDAYEGKVKSSVLFESSSDLSAVVFTAPADVRFRITDKQGRVVGTLDTGTAEDAEAKAVNQIPGASYSSRPAWRDPTCIASPPPPGAGTNQVILPGVQDDYKIEIIDAEGKSTSVAVHTYDKAGNPSIVTIDNAGAAVAEVKVDPQKGAPPEVNVINGGVPTPEAQFTPGGAAGGDETPEARETATAATAPATLPVTTSTPTPRPELRTSLALPAEPGQTRVETADNAGFELGDTIRFSPGLPNEEDNVIVGFGSFILATPLKYTHSPGEIILRLPRAPGQGPGLPPGITPPPDTGGPLKPPSEVDAVCDVLYVDQPREATLICDVTVTGEFTSTRWSLNGTLVPEFNGQNVLLVSFDADGPASVSVSVCNVTICRSASVTEKIEFPPPGTTAGGGATTNTAPRPTATPPAQGVAIECDIEFIEGVNRRAAITCDALFNGPFTSVSWSAAGATPSSASGISTQFKTEVSSQATVRVTATVCNFSVCATSEPKTVSVGGTTTKIFTSATKASPSDSVNTVAAGNVVSFTAVITGAPPPSGGSVTFYVVDGDERAPLAAGAPMFAIGSTGFAQLNLVTGVPPMNIFPPLQDPPLPPTIYTIEAEYSGGTTSFGSKSNPNAEVGLTAPVPDVCDSVDNDDGGTGAIDETCAFDAPNRSIGGGTILTGISINGGGNSVVLAPGATFSVTGTANRAAEECPGCIRQVYFSIGANNANGLPASPAQCVYSGGMPSSSPGVTLGTATFTAPATPGLYYIRASSTLDYQCVPIQPAQPDLSVARLLVRGTASVSVDVATSSTFVTIGQSFTLTATVGPASGTLPPDAVTGQVEFRANGVPLSILPRTIVGGEATLSGVTLPLGNYEITAHYLGSPPTQLEPPYYDPGQSDALDFEVRRVATTTTLAVEETTPALGESITLTATIQDADFGADGGSLDFFCGSAGTTCGSVEFFYGAQSLGIADVLRSDVDADATSIVATTELTVDTGVSGAFLTSAGVPLSITAQFTGTVNLAPSPGSTSVTLAQAPSTVSLVISQTSATLGATVTLAATVDAGGVPVGPGSLRFFYVTQLGGSPVLDQLVDMNGEGLATLVLPTGVAPFLVAGTYAGIRAEYSDTVSPNVEGSTSAAGSLTLEKAASEVTVVITPNSLALGGAVTLTATVTGPFPVDTGFVQFKSGNDDLGVPQAVTSTVAGPPAFTGVATLVFTTGNVPLDGTGTTNITAAYTGTTQLLPDDSPAVPLTITRGGSATALTLTTASQVLGQPGSMTAVVSSAANGKPISGDVEFRNGATVLGTATLAKVGGNQQATLSMAAVPVGVYAVTASYLGDSNYGPSDSTPAQALEITKATPTATVLSPVGVELGQPVTLTANVAVGGVSTGVFAPEGGTITFFVGGVELGVSAPIAAGEGGASIVVSTPATVLANAGPYTITAVYNGNSQLNASAVSAAQTLTLAKATPTVTLTITPGTVTLGDTVSFSATVTAAAGVDVGTGNVTFSYGNGPGITRIPIDIAPLVSGVATLTVTTSEPPFVTAGTYGGVRAEYATTSNVSAANSTPLQALVVGKAVSAVAVSVSPSTASLGTGVTLTATVTGPFPVDGTGLVQFRRDGANIGALQNVASGTATLALTAGTSPLTGPAGTSSITALYLGNSQQGSATSAGVDLTITAATTTTALVLSTTAQGIGQGGTMTATVSSGFTGTINGNIEFRDGATVLGGAAIPVGNVTGGRGAVFNMSGLPVGTYNVTAYYIGAGNYAASDSAPAQALTINKVTPDTTLDNLPVGADLGTEVRLRATVGVGGSSSGVFSPAGGTITFFAGGVQIGTSPAIATGTAAAFIDVATPGTVLANAGTAYSITAVYNGNTNLNASAASPAKTLTLDQAQAEIVMDAPSPASVQFGTAVTFRATITAPGMTIPACALCVEFRLGSATGNLIGATNYNGTEAVLPYTAGAAPMTTIQSHTIVAVYLETASTNITGDTSPTRTLTITRAVSTVTVSALGTVTIGDNVTFDATIAVANGVSAACSGCFRFRIASTTGTVLDGAADVNAAGEVVGFVLPTGSGDLPDPATLTIFGVYDGNTNVLGDSDSEGLTITAAPTSIAASATQTGGTVTLRADITSAFGAKNDIDPGTVQFFVDGTAVGTAQGVNNGVATLDRTLTAGLHQITATYSGGGDYAASGPSAQFAITVT